MKFSINNLNMVYSNGKTALRNVSLELTSPSFIGLLGPNGAGKSTLMKLLTCQLLPTDGSIICDNAPLNSQELTLKKQLGYLPQRFGFYDELSVWEYLDYMCALKGIKNSREEIARVIGQTSLEEKKKARIATLSGGQRQRVGIAQALLGTPKLLIFDEPTVGLDPEERVKFRNLFSQAAADKIVLLSTHIVEDVQSVCNRVIVIDDGEILYDGTPQRLLHKAAGHVGSFLENGQEHIPQNLRVTNRTFTAHGVRVRLVGEHLPPFVEPLEPILEDAYMLLLAKKEGHQ